MSIDFKEFKRIDCREVARRLGMEVDRSGKTRCFHSPGDANPSLQIYPDGFKCFRDGESGDQIDLVSQYLGISKSDAAEWIGREFNVQQTPSRKNDYGKLEREHIYPGGTIKKCMYRRADKSKYGEWYHLENGKWLKGRGEGIPPLYPSSDNLASHIFLTEGEKDVDTWRRLGKSAISLPNGSNSKWYPEYRPAFEGKNVFIIQDNDTPGKEYAQRMAATLKPIASCVKVLDLSNAWKEIPEKGDTTDLIEAMGDEAGLMAILKLAQETPEWEPLEVVAAGRTVKAAADFGEDNTSFLWYPYLPIGDYSVMMADGGTGKTVLCCKIAADVSTGRRLPGDEFDGKSENVLIISAEDSGEQLKRRLKLSGADLNRVFIIDRSDSIGMNFSDGYSEFESTVKSCKPALVIVDPWHGFLGENIDINRVNAIRPVFQKLANLAKTCDCAMILISHVNKRAQGENVNNAATGSSDFINAARSAVRVIFDEMDEDCRIMVHTKTNYAAYGQSIRYRIVDGGVEWAGFSDITRQTLEAAARRKSTPWEIMQKTEEQETVNNALVVALEQSANQFVATRYSYDEFKKDHGDLIFGGLQPKRALDSVKDRLSDDGYFLKTGIQVKKNGSKGNGFMVQRIDTTVAEQSMI